MARIDSNTKLVLEYNQSNQFYNYINNTVLTSVGYSLNDNEKYLSKNPIIPVLNTNSITIPNAQMPLSSSSFTIEFFIKGTSAQYGNILSSGSSATDLIISTNSSGLGTGSSVNGEIHVYPFALNSGISVLDGNWHHVAIVRNGTSVMLFIDGVLKESLTSSITLNSSAYSFGSGYQPAFMGGIVDFGVTIGAAKYTANFTPPTEAFVPGYYSKFLISTGNEIYSFKQGVIGSTNAIPTMTSATAPSGVVTADSFSDARSPYFAFDNNISTFWYNYNSVPSGGHWIQYEFPTPKAIGKINLASTGISGGSYGLKDFQLYGSNDGLNYVLIYSDTHPNNSDIKAYTINNNIKYKFYRLNALGSYYSANNYIAISSFEMYEKSDNILYQLESSNEQDFIQYGTNTSTNVNLLEKYTKKTCIASNSSTMGTGKVFKKIIDTSKIKINKTST